MVSSQPLQKFDNLNALWIGGPAGKSFLRIRHRLSEFGIHIKHQWDRTTNLPQHIPAHVDLALVNIDRVRHTLSSPARTRALKAGVPCFDASESSIQTVNNILSSNLFPIKSVENTMVKKTITTSKYTVPFNYKEITLLLEDEIVYAISPMAKNNSRRRSRTIVFQNLLFLSQSHASTYYGAGPSALKQYLSKHPGEQLTYRGQQCHYPTFDEACKMLEQERYVISGDDKDANSKIASFANQPSVVIEPVNQHEEVKVAEPAINHAELIAPEQVGSKFQQWVDDSKGIAQVLLAEKESLETKHASLTLDLEANEKRTKEISELLYKIQLIAE